MNYAYTNTKTSSIRARPRPLSWEAVYQYEILKMINMFDYGNEIDYGKSFS